MAESTLLKWSTLLDSPSWDQYLEMRRRQDGQVPTNITIADQVYALYGGKSLGESIPAVERAYKQPTRDNEGAVTFDELSVAL